MDITSNQQLVKQAELRKKALAEKKKKLFIKKIIIVAVVVVLFAAGFAAYSLKFADSDIKKNQYQAVFLTNGQVYFGKLSNSQSKYLKLQDVYYLQVQSDQKEAQAQNQQPAIGEPQLIKLGEELHGPEDFMNISEDQVTFWENLKQDSKVVKAIQQYKTK